MATTQISVEEYLSTTSDPDCEYVHGVIKERAVPEYDHAAWQAALIHWFGNRELEWNVRVFPSLRTKVSEDSYRVPDISVLSRNALWQVAHTCFIRSHYNKLSCPIHTAFLRHGWEPQIPRRVAPI